MSHTNFFVALLTAAALAACGGSGNSGGDQTLKLEFKSQVTFGDSLSDVGTYNVGAVKAAGGGKFTINGDNTARDPVLTGKNWTELIAAQLKLAAPCPAQTGLDGDPAQGFYVPVVNDSNCTSYAQGGARVTNPIGPHHKALGDPLGALTVPVVTQIQRHLALNGDRFTGDEIVTVTVGGNDVLMQLGAVSAGASAQAAVDEMSKAGAELVALVKTQLVGKGANYVIVNNIPDIASAPAGKAQPAPAQQLIAQMVGAFNKQLSDGLSAEPNVLLVDLFGISRDQVANPGRYGLSNTSTPACGPNALNSSLICTGSNVIAGDVGHYMFADDIHPTPFEYSLIASSVLQRMTVRGWL